MEKDKILSTQNIVKKIKTFEDAKEFVESSKKNRFIQPSFISFLNNNEIITEARKYSYKILPIRNILSLMGLSHMRPSDIKEKFPKFLNGIFQGETDRYIHEQQKLEKTNDVLAFKCFMDYFEKFSVTNYFLRISFKKDVLFLEKSYKEEEDTSIFSKIRDGVIRSIDKKLNIEGSETNWNKKRYEYDPDI